jgi:hypothetical protein
MDVAVESHEKVNRECCVENDFELGTVFLKGLTHCPHGERGKLRKSSIRIAENAVNIRTGPPEYKLKTTAIFKGKECILNVCLIPS